MLPTLLHSTGTEEIDRHDAASGNVTDPVVVVLSVYVPSALATNEPVVCTEPFTGTVVQPRLVRMTSMSPDSFRQEDLTFQVPTTLPPQGDTLLQLVPEPIPELPPAPELLPPVLVVPPAPVPPLAGAPPVPDGLPEWVLQAVLTAINPSTNAPTRPRCPRCMIAL